MEMLNRFSKSTRFSTLIIATLMVIAFFVYGQTTPDPKDWVSQDTMIDFIKWAYGIYAASEIGSKVAANNKAN